MHATGVEHGPARLTAIASGKGGVGKTWFAITLAHAWARLGRRVALFDGDLGLANIDIQLGLPPGPGLSAALDGKLTMARAARHLPDLGFDVLAGHSGNLAMASLGKDVIAAMLAGLRGLPYDDIVLDLGAGLDHATRLLAASAETLVVLATDEPTSLTDAYAVIKVHAADTQAAGRGDVRIVVNQAGSVAAGSAPMPPWPAPAAISCNAPPRSPASCGAMTGCGTPFAARRRC